MDDALVMGGGEGIGDLLRDIENLSELQRIGGEARLEASPVQQLHGDEGLPVAIALLDVQDGADVGMVERGRESRLTLEASEGVSVL